MSDLWARFALAFGVWSVSLLEKGFQGGTREDDRRGRQEETSKDPVKTKLWARGAQGFLSTSPFVVSSPHRKVPF